MTKIDELLQQIRVETGAFFIATDIVGMDGISVGGGSISPDFDSTAASARFAMVMKLATQVSKKLGLGEMEDDLVTTDKAYVITRYIGDGTYFWDIAVSRDATLGTVRMMMNEYGPQLWDAIPH